MRLDVNIFFSQQIDLSWQEMKIPLYLQLDTLREHRCKETMSIFSTKIRVPTTNINISYRQKSNKQYSISSALESDWILSPSECLLFINLCPIFSFASAPKQNSEGSNAFHITPVLSFYTHSFFYEGILFDAPLCDSYVMVRCMRNIVSLPHHL